MKHHSVALIIASIISVGCAGSFEEARLVGGGSKLAAPATPEDRARCIKLDDERIEDSAKAKGLGTIAGTSAGAVGLVHYFEPLSKEWIAISGSVVVVVAAGAGYYLVRSEGKSEAWVRECSK